MPTIGPAIYSELGLTPTEALAGFCLDLGMLWSVAWSPDDFSCVLMNRASSSWSIAKRCMLHVLDTAWPAAGIRLCAASRLLHTSCSLQRPDPPSDNGAQREAMDFDVAIVGAGPAGLSAAIRLKQRCKESDKALSVCVVEKGAEVGESG